MGFAALHPSYEILRIRYDWRGAAESVTGIDAASRHEVAARAYLLGGGVAGWGAGFLSPGTSADMSVPFTVSEPPP
jgi:hypothetical protein